CSKYADRRYGGIFLFAVLAMTAYQFFHLRLMEIPSFQPKKKEPYNPEAGHSKTLLFLPDRTFVWESHRPPGVLFRFRVHVQLPGLFLSFHFEEGLSQFPP